ncbi:membrane metalloprotease [Methylophaga frappieri]|uniref:Membrane metalloprotease n=1 Tax=Methylophaga frappieri (strain ATCC BAA-2434 / DSM 25690 / JAM7) TaxID=754477 RepID=I1YK52_METFJ|nr:site-2 protease family protein [Methylophaga frappieri]AFJ03295.1 membrane metalloprotease [Methylophaga frappieri]
MDEFSLVQKIIIWTVPVLFAITLHEVAHGWMALKLGDRTAQMLGRLSLNPIKHIDPIGTIVVPGILLLLGGFIFGWAKPVPVSYQNLRKPKSDMAWVALAGPGANLAMGLVWAVVAKLGFGLVQAGNSFGEPMFYMGLAGIWINAILMFLNLLPLPPLDGGRVLVSVLPGKLGWQVSRIEPYGFFIILGLLAFGILGLILSPMLNTTVQILAQWLGISFGQAASLLNSLF